MGPVDRASVCAIVRLQVRPVLHGVLMKIVVASLALAAYAALAGQRAPISADEVKLRHEIYVNQTLTVFRLDIPPGQATLPHRHDRDMLI